MSYHMCMTTATIYLRHADGATHEYGGRRATTLRRECLAGRGMQEIVALRLAGYVGFFTASQEVEDLDALPDYYGNQEE